MSDAQDNLVTPKRSVSFSSSIPQSSGSGPTPFVMPRQTGTGTTRGTQNISGLEVVTDPVSRIPMIMFGFSKGAFNGSDFGLKISRIDPKTGTPFDVTTATNEQLAFVSPSDTQLLYNQHIPQLLFGLQLGGFKGQDYGLKVSKINPVTGTPYDVTTATDDQLAFNSAFDTFKILSTDVTSLTSINSPTGASPVTATVTHNLGLIPGLVAYTEFGGFRFPLPYTLYNVTTGAIRKRIYAQIDANDVTFVYQDWETGGGIYTYNIRYYLLQETAA